MTMKQKFEEMVKAAGYKLNRNGEWWKLVDDPLEAQIYYDEDFEEINVWLVQGNIAVYEESWYPDEDTFEEDMSELLEQLDYQESDHWCSRHKELQ